MKTIVRNNYTPHSGDYRNTIVQDDAQNKTWLFDCGGTFLDISSGRGLITVANEAGDHEEYAISQAFVTHELRDIKGDITIIDGDIDNINEEIRLIKAASDVVDIVGTYADLLTYDTTKLNDNDTIKVLVDETHDDAESYYRWSTSTEAFSYVGSLGPFYTENEIDTLLGGKQNTLTAGHNISIDGSTIAATDEIPTLTTEDYNYPTTGEKEYIATWLLDDGIYHVAPNAKVLTSRLWNSIADSKTFLIVNRNELGQPVYMRNMLILGGEYRVDTINLSGDIVQDTFWLLGPYDNLTSTSTTHALSAKQGKALNDRLVTVENTLTGLETALHTINNGGNA